MNLLKETEEMLTKHNKTWEDVEDIITEYNPDRKSDLVKASISVECFSKIANREYYDGFGAQEVNSSLMIVGDNWWMERHEYDGSEWWEYKEKPNLEEYPMMNEVSDRAVFDYWN